MCMLLTAGAAIGAVSAKGAFTEQHSRVADRAVSTVLANVVAGSRASVRAERFGAASLGKGEPHAKCHC